jgi:CheY-like chemotaxis protein
MAGPKILVIDDKLDMRRLIAFPLQRQLDAEVLHAWGATDGLEIALAARPDLIVLDLIMPRLDGWETAALLRSRPETASIPILALTVACRPCDRTRALEAGCDIFLPKPFTVIQLLDAVSATLACASRPPVTA